MEHSEKTTIYIYEYDRKTLYDNRVVRHVKIQTIYRRLYDVSWLGRLLTQAADSIYGVGQWDRRYESNPYNLCAMAGWYAVRNDGSRDCLTIGYLNVCLGFRKGGAL